MNKSELDRQSLIEIVKRIQVDHGDILLARFEDAEIVDTLFDIFAEMHPDKQILVIHIDDLDILKEADEDMMRELGWERIKNDNCE